MFVDRFTHEVLKFRFYYIFNCNVFYLIINDLFIINEKDCYVKRILKLYSIFHFRWQIRSLHAS